MPEGNLDWENYKHQVELHRGYLDLAIKINAFYYAITGAIVSFYFLHIDDEPLVNFSLLLPITMSLGLIVFFYRSALASKVSQTSIASLAERLGFKVYSVVAQVLEVLLWIFFTTLLVVFIGLGILFFKNFNICA